jgi:hypothetical protein
MFHYSNLAAIIAVSFSGTRVESLRTATNTKKQNSRLSDFRLPSRSRGDLHSSEMLRGLEW